MSRLAKTPIVIRDGVEFSSSGTIISLKGPKGSLSIDYHPDLSIIMEDNQIRIDRKTDTKFARAISGTTAVLIKNMIVGVTEGYQKKLQLVGVGYRASAQGNKVNLSLGFSHPVVYEVPEGITIETPSQTEIIVKGIDRQKVGQAAAEIRAYRPPEPYKGKGIKEQGQYILRKEGKKK